MGYILKDGRPLFIGRNVNVTPVKSDLREKRETFFLDARLIGVLSAADSKRFLELAKSDPVAFTYSVWRMFNDSAKDATAKLCDLAIKGNGGHVIKAIKIMFFDAAPKINAFSISYIVTQLGDYIDTDPRKVRRAFERMFLADLTTTCTVVKAMYEASPRGTKDIAKLLMTSRKMRFFKLLIKPMLKQLSLKPYRKR